jgi:hypothetical protein
MKIGAPSLSVPEGCSFSLLFILSLEVALSSVTSFELPPPSTLQLHELAIGGKGDLLDTDASSHADCDLGANLVGAASIDSSNCSTLHRGIAGTFEMTYMNYKQTRFSIQEHF